MGKEKEPVIVTDIEEGEGFLTIPKAALFAGGISEARIRLALTKGELDRYKAGPGSHARTLILKSDLRKFIRKAD